jgi:hypothetical protein
VQRASQEAKIPPSMAVASAAIDSWKKSRQGKQSPPFAETGVAETFGTESAIKETSKMLAIAATRNMLVDRFFVTQEKLIKDNGKMASKMHPEIHDPRADLKRIEQQKRKADKVQSFSKGVKWNCVIIAFRILGRITAYLTRSKEQMEAKHASIAATQWL